MIRVDVWDANRMAEIHIVNLPTIDHVFTGNFWDYHPGCHGSITHGEVTVEEFSGYYGLASQLAEKLDTGVEVVNHNGRWWDCITINPNGTVDIPNYEDD